MEDMSMVLEPLRTFLVQFGEFLPRLILAVLIAIAGWLIAKAFRLAVVKGLKAVNFHVLTERAGMDRFLQQGGTRTDTISILAALVYWLVILAALILAFNSLGLVYVTDLLGRIALFVPRVIVTVVVLAFGAYFAHFIDTTITTYGRNVKVADAEILGRLGRYAVMIFTVLIALDQLNIGGDIIRQSFLIILAGVVFALALAFGLGGRRWAEDLLERWWPQRNGRDIDNRL